MMAGLLEAGRGPFSSGGRSGCGGSPGLRSGGLVGSGSWSRRFKVFPPNLLVHFPLAHEAAREIATADVGGDAGVGGAGHEEAAIPPQRHTPAATGFHHAIDVAGFLPPPRPDTGEESSA